MNRRRFIQVGAGGAAAALWALEGCSRGESQSDDEQPSEGPTAQANDQGVSEPESEPKGTMRIAFANAPTQLDPAFMTLNSAIQVGFMVYDGLVWVDHQLTPQPALAEEWEVAGDLLSWTFTLRRDVSFHHGTPFTAVDVVYSMERLLDPTLGSPLRTVLSFIESVEAIEDGSSTGAVRFDLTSANADLPLLLGAPQARIVPHDYDAPLLASAPSGTGPFRLVEASLGDRIIFTRNNEYWAPDILHLQEVHHIYLTTFEAQASAIDAGEVDLLPDVSMEQATILAENDDIGIVEAPSGAYQTVVMQATEEPFNDSRVRKALKLSLDRSALKEMVLGERGEIGYDHPVPSVSPFHANLPAPEQNIELARQLLTDAGYPDGLKLDLVTADLDPGMVGLAQAMQEIAAPAGFEIVPIDVPTDVYWDTYWTHVPFHIGSWNFRPSIDETFSIAYYSQSAWNESQWSTPELDALIEAARSEPNFEKRKALYQEAQAILMDDGAVVIPYFRPVLIAVRTSVHGFTPHPAGWLDLRGVKN